MKFIFGLIIGVTIAIAACSQAEENAFTSKSGSEIGIDKGTPGKPDYNTKMLFISKSYINAIAYIHAIAYGYTETGKEVIIKVDDDGRVFCK